MLNITIKHLSHELGIAQKEMNKLQNKLFGIECNFEELNGIDFKKNYGCSYVGTRKYFFKSARIKLNSLINFLKESITISCYTINQWKIN